MKPYLTGTVIKQLREQHRLTQAELAQKLNVSDKSVSKWETGKGVPDITLLEPIAAVFGISLSELLSGNVIHNTNLSSNLLRSRFYVCPVCGNVVHSMGELAPFCHGIQLSPQTAEPCDEHHGATVERVDDELYVHIDHEMTKSHYISFVAALSLDRIQLVKLYPEGEGECRFPVSGVRKILFYCNKDGLFSQDVRKPPRQK